MKMIWKIFIVFLIIIIVGGLGSKYYYEVNTKPVVTDGEIESIEIEIPNGSSTEKIASILEENNLIRNKNIFRIVSKIKGTDGKLKAGLYEIKATMTPEEILDKLVEGGTNSSAVKFTIPEGYTIEEMAERLSDEKIVDKDKFLSLTDDVEKFAEDYEFLQDVPDNMNLEGYLFPQTYEVYPDTSEEDIIRKMLDEFNKIYVKKLKGESFKQNLNINELVTLASIVERESKMDEERPKIAEVFYNRLEMEMKLQSCATVQYILGERKANLSIADTQIDSVYNTYMNVGLPPTPIASPGLDSIEATINPEEHDYIYFVLKKDESGKHFFTDDYDEFLSVKNSN
ncbi:endolytic transglycosylase MltG [Clostridium sp. D2Q-14]|uniref:endolytic transglycosylase MltG n=1 Tax=Anaeromonas gelatinilytica TaxID=2683194 RepID=UPI00193C348F|nr:endolytic transglycosylase MltG [Anaeromonas gelatinilytica]MBS4535364.1 endolytic transglycosylase MltG [Anaeromonas gelatinilytica]